MPANHVIDFKGVVYKGFVTLPKSALRRDRVLDLYSELEEGMSEHHASQLDDAFYYAAPLFSIMQKDELGLYYPAVHFSKTLARQQQLMAEQINQINPFKQLKTSFKRFYEVHEYKLEAWLVDLTQQTYDDKTIARIYAEGLSGVVIAREAGEEVILFRSAAIRTLKKTFGIHAICSKEQQKILFEGSGVDLPLAELAFKQITEAKGVMQ